MSAPAFTPGPWEIVITRVGPDEIRAGDGSGDLICELPYGASAEPDASTARLIAAAPELYEALESLVHAVEAAHWPFTAEQMEPLNTARAALAKAGRS